MAFKDISYAYNQTKLCALSWYHLFLMQAVCCSDGKHCCPENTKCEVSSGKCLRGDSLIMDWFEKTPAMRAQNVVCPDGQSQCKTGQTCCKLSSGQYGCCPLPKVSVLEMPIYCKDLQVYWFTCHLNQLKSNWRILKHHNYVLVSSRKLKAQISFSDYLFSVYSIFTFSSMSQEPQGQSQPNFA